ncbi:MAG: erythromycin esterase family protein [Bacteroidota bacterium]
MKHLLSSFLLFTISYSLYSQIPVWTQSPHFVPIKNQNNLDDFSDLMPLKELLKDKRLISLGENTHGLGDQFQLKARLAVFLHEELDFDLILFEEGLSDMGLIWQRLDRLSKEELKTKFLHYYQNEEMEDLYAYLKNSHVTSDPLILQGIDCQAQQDYFKSVFSEIAAPYDKMLADSLRFGLHEINNMYAHQITNKDQKAFYKSREKFAKSCKELEGFLKKYEEKLYADKSLNRQEFKLFMRSLQNFKAYTGLEYGDLWSSVELELRDSLMAENIAWLLEEAYPGKKALIWAHNYHIAKENVYLDSTKWMGVHLKERYKDAYYSLGSLVYKGAFFNHFSREVFEFENKGPFNMEYQLNKAGETYFLLNLKGLKQNDDNSWMFNWGLWGFQQNGFSQYILSQRFDGLLFLRESGPPTFDEK